MKTSTKENGLELKVGLFLCIGLAIIGAMILEFSLGGKQGFKKYYALNVDLPNANGLLKGSDVLVAGSSVGYVADKPVLASSLGAVRVTVMVDEKVKIPKGAVFKVDSSGLLGDKFVSIQMASDFKSAEFNPNDPSQVYQPGDVIKGERSKDITEIATDASKKLNDALDNLKEVVDNLKTGVLSPDSLDNLKQSFASVKSMTQKWDEASGKLPGIAKSAQDAVDKANQTMGTAKEAAEDLRKTLENARNLMQKASEGQGLIGQLLTNRQLADNFNALVINLREHGVLFYRNSAKPAPESSPAPSPQPVKRKR